MPRYSLFMLKVPLKPQSINQPTNLMVYYYI